MKTYRQRPVQAGFTLVELLIVVIILSVLAAIIVPQFTSATVDAKEAQLDANLARLRSAVELYHAQHDNKYPGATASNVGCSSKGSGAANSGQSLIEQLTMYTDSNGGTCATGDTTYKYGPYLRKGMPSDPFTGKGAVAADIAVPATPTGAPLAPSAATGGWAYDPVSGQIVMNSNANDSKGKAYSTH